MRSAEPPAAAAHCDRQGHSQDHCKPSRKRRLVSRRDNGNGTDNDRRHRGPSPRPRELCGQPDQDWDSAGKGGGDVTNVAAQQEIAMLKRHLKLQNDVITGMCRLRAFEAENRLPARF